MTDYTDRIRNFASDVERYGSPEAARSYWRWREREGDEWYSVIDAKIIMDYSIIVERRPVGEFGGYAVSRYTPEDPPVNGSVVWRPDPFSPTPDTDKPSIARALSFRYNDKAYEGHRALLVAGFVCKDSESAINQCTGIHEAIREL